MSEKRRLTWEEFWDGFDARMTLFERGKISAIAIKEYLFGNYYWRWSFGYGR